MKSTTRIKTLQVSKYFLENYERMSIRDISDDLHIPKSVIHECLTVHLQKIDPVLAEKVKIILEEHSHSMVNRNKNRI